MLLLRLPPVSERWSLARRRERSRRSSGSSKLLPLLRRRRCRLLLRRGGLERPLGPRHAPQRRELGGVGGGAAGVLTVILIFLVVEVDDFVAVCFLSSFLFLLLLLPTTAPAPVSAIVDDGRVGQQPREERPQRLANGPEVRRCPGRQQRPAKPPRQRRAEALLSETRVDKDDRAPVGAVADAAAYRLVEGAEGLLGVPLVAGQGAACFFFVCVRGLVGEKKLKKIF